VRVASAEGAAGRGGDGAGVGDGRGAEGRSDAPQSRQRPRSAEFNAPQSAQIVSGLVGTVAMEEESRRAHGISLCAKNLRVSHTPGFAAIFLSRFRTGGRGGSSSVTSADSV
jgi:hypothetical protein